MTTSHVIKPLTPETFPAWLALAQKHNGVWGGCYCSYFHGDTEQTVKDDYDRATFKQRLVEEGVAHAALVFDGMTALDLFGPLEVLGNFPNAEFVYVTPDESITAEQTGIKIDVTAGFDEVDSADILLIPGGQGTRRLMKDGATIDWIRKIDKTTT